jgi:hypothetical protein
MIAMGCASAQMNHELKEGQPLASPPVKKAMDRGIAADETNTELDDEDQWWKQKKDGFWKHPRPKLEILFVQTLKGNSNKTFSHWGKVILLDHDLQNLSTITSEVFCNIGTIQYWQLHFVSVSIYLGISKHRFNHMHEGLGNAKHCHQHDGGY